VSSAANAPPPRYLDTALAVLRSIPAASVIAFDHELRCVLVTGAAIGHAGFEASVIEGRALGDVLPAERWALWEPIYRSALRGEAQSVEVEGIGTSRWYQVEVGPWRYASGAIAGGLAVARDITERKRLDVVSANLAAVVASSTDAIISKTVDGTIVSWNPGAEKLYGYSQEEVIGKSIELLLPKGHDDQVTALLARVIAGEDVGPYETVRRRKDGSTVEALLTVSSVRDLSGRVVGASTIAHDVTEAKAAEAALAQAREDIDRFFSLSLDLMMIANAEGQFVRVNLAFEQVLGYAPSELTGRPFADFIHPDDLQDTLDALSTQTAGSAVVVFENRYRCKDGPYRWLLWNASTLADGWIYGTARDITDRKQMDDDMRISRERALEASRLKSEFVANMSHEIRTPLNGVVCMSELLLDQDLTGEQREYAQVAMTSAEALMAVINDILDFSKIEAGKLDILNEDFSIEAAVGDVCEIVSGKAHENRTELAVSIAEDVPDIVRGDPNRVRQVLINLVSNAVKFTSGGEVLVRVSLELAADTTERLRLEVSDTGIGIDPERQEQLFQAFSQGDNSNTRRYGGTGLGLSIAKQLVELMGGEIGVQSRPGEGSTFWLTVPCERGVAVSDEARVRDLTGTRVLIVDDNVTNRRILERQLAHWGITPVSAADGRSALGLLNRAADSGRPYEAAVIDMNMPGIDGLELAKSIKAAARLRSTRLILLSSSPVRSEDVRAVGIDAELTKPVRQSRLYNQLVATLTRPSRAPVALTPSPPEATVAQNGGHVLVAEDNQVNQFAATRLLQRLGFTVDIAHNGREAINMTGHTDYAAVFMDCQMPEIDGYTATAVIRRRDHATKHTPIIAVTAHALGGDRDKCLAAGMDEYLSKPLRIPEVQAMIGRLPTLAADTRQEAPDTSKMFDPAPLSDIGDRETEATLVTMFVDQAAGRLPELRRAIDEDAAETLRQLAHGLKGSAATVGACRMSELCDALGKLAAAGHTSGADEIHLELVDALRDTAAAMNTYVKETIA
jgi:two-component system sensor histidine kinase/response regulator